MGVTAKRSCRQRGATAVEAALVAPLMFLAIFGVMEFSLLLRTSLGASNASADGARTASVAGRDLDSDYRTLRQIEKSASALPDDVIERIVIFKAATFDADVPPACLTVAAPGGINDVCNVYLPAQMEWPESEFGCNPAADPRPDPDRFWCPADRVVSVGTGLDFVGVHLVVDHEYATGMFGDHEAINETTVLKIEPEAQ